MRYKKYTDIINILLKYYDIDETEFIDLLKIKENKYLLLLILSNNNCLYVESLQKLLNLKSNRTINYNLKKAEEKLLINKNFRENYFEIEDLIQKNNKIQ